MCIYLIHVIILGCPKIQLLVASLWLRNDKSWGWQLLEPRNLCNSVLVVMGVESLTSMEACNLCEICRARKWDRLKYQFGTHNWKRVINNLNCIIINLHTPRWWKTPLVPCNLPTLEGSCCICKYPKFACLKLKFFKTIISLKSLLTYVILLQIDRSSPHPIHQIEQCFNVFFLKKYHGVAYARPVQQQLV